MTIDGQAWELKTVTGASPDAVARNIRQASYQARRVVPDMTNSPISDEASKVLVAHYANRYKMQSVRVIRGSTGMDWTNDNAEH